jgi:hypothetical protein
MKKQKLYIIFGRDTARTEITWGNYMQITEHEIKTNFVSFYKHRGTEAQRAAEVLLVPRNFSRGRGVIPSLAKRGEQSCQHGYFQFGM